MFRCCIVTACQMLTIPQRTATARTVEWCGVAVVLLCCCIVRWRGRTAARGPCLPCVVPIIHRCTYSAPR